MDVAAFIIGLLALILSTVSITLQFANRKAKEPEAMAFDPFDSDEVSEEELPPLKETRDAIEIQKTADVNRMNDLFANPDIPYTGIDDEFENF